MTRDVRSVDMSYWIEQASRRGTPRLDTASENVNSETCDGIIYRIQPGDTLFRIAQRFDVNLEELILWNPQVENPERILTGQLLCIPEARVSCSRCTVLESTEELAVTEASLAGGSVLIHGGLDGRFAIVFTAIGLPAPSTLGNYDSYIGSLHTHSASFSVLLGRSAPGQQAPTWCGTHIIPDPTASDMTFIVRAVNSTGDIVGPVVLRGTGSS